MKQGQIITIQKNRYIVKSDDLKVSCVIRGKIHKQQLLPRVGDFVLFDENKQVIECLYTNTEFCEKIHKYLKINDIVGVKGHLEVLKNEICVICDKLTFLSSKESEVKENV